MDLSSFMALLVFAMGELVIAEIIGLAITKESAFKKTEFFIFSTIGCGVIIFFLSGLLQDSIILQLAQFGWWLLLIFIIVFCINIFILAKYSLGRTWKFRLVVIPLVVIGITIGIALLIYWGITTNNQQLVENIATNISGVLP